MSALYWRFSLTYLQIKYSTILQAAHVKDIGLYLLTFNNLLVLCTGSICVTIQWLGSWARLNDISKISASTAGNRKWYGLKDCELCYLALKNVLCQPVKLASLQPSAMIIAFTGGYVTFKGIGMMNHCLLVNAEFKKCWTFQQFIEDHQSRWRYEVLHLIF